MMLTPTQQEGFSVALTVAANAAVFTSNRPSNPKNT
jgi:hypothetical protein